MIRNAGGRSVRQYDASREEFSHDQSRLLIDLRVFRIRSMKPRGSAPQKALPVDAKEKNASTGSPFGFWLKSLLMAAKL